MTDDRKRRGRPRGSEKDDRKALMAVADRMVTDKTLKPTTAMRRCNPKISDAEVRRLQEKWKERGATLLTEAHARAAQRITAPTYSGRGLPVGNFAREIEQYRKMQEIYDSPAMKIMRDFQNNPILKVMREIENDPVRKAILEHQRLLEMTSGLSKYL